MTETNRYVLYRDDNSDLERQLVRPTAARHAVAKASRGGGGMAAAAVAVAAPAARRTGAIHVVSRIGNNESLLVDLSDEERRQLQRANPRVKLVREGIARMAFAAVDL